MRVRQIRLTSLGQSAPISEEELVGRIESAKYEAGKLQRFYIVTLDIFNYTQTFCGFKGDQIGFCIERARSYRACKVMIRAQEKFIHQFAWLRCLEARQKRMKSEEEN